MPPAPVADSVPWGTPYVSGTAGPQRALPPSGAWTLHGAHAGAALVHIRFRRTGLHVDVRYTNFSDDGLHIINGTESADTLPAPTLTSTSLLWHSDLTLSGKQSGTKVTSEPGGYTLTIDLLTNVISENGTLTTTIDGHAYHQPANGT